MANLVGRLFTRLGLRTRKGYTFTPIDESQRAGLLPRTHFDYAGAVRQGLDSNVVMAPIQWIMRTFPEAEPVVDRRRGRAAPWAMDDEHPVEQLLQRPNPYYDGVNLFMAVALSYFMDGNAYLVKARNRFGKPIELWYAPHWTMEPRWPSDGSQFLTHYDYTVNGQLYRVPPRDVVHLRFGLDPRNPRKGLSQLRAIMREVFTDDEAANFTAQILKNMGVPGLVIAPKEGGYVDPEALKEMKAYAKEQWNGDHRGEPFVVGAPTEIHQFGFDPSKLMLANIRDIAEERICAALGIPAAVVGFGAGLQSTKVGATMRELRRLAWVQCITPSQRAIARQLSQQLLPEFEENPTRFRVRFDTEGVSAFQEEETERARRVAVLVTSGIVRVDQGQEMLGLEADPDARVYLRPVNTQPVPFGEYEAVAGEDEEEEQDEGGPVVEEPSGTGTRIEPVGSARNRIAPVLRTTPGRNGRGG